MYEKTALTISLIGILILLLLSQIEPYLENIEDINKKSPGNWVKVRGTIKNIKRFNKITIINMKSFTSNSSISVIVYTNNITLPCKGTKIEIIGRIIEYKGNKEIEAIKIKII